MPEFALYIAGTFQSPTENKPSRPDDIPHKQVAWYPVSRPMPSYNAATEKLIGPSAALTGDQHVISYTVEAKTAEEILAEKEAKVTNYDRLSFLVNLDQENRIRAIERVLKYMIPRVTGLNAGERTALLAELPANEQVAITEQQYLTALKNAL